MIEISNSNNDVVNANANGNYPLDDVNSANPTIECEGIVFILHKFLFTVTINFECELA